jgi:hypothetical protein
VTEGTTNRWGRTIAVLDRRPPTDGPQRYLLAYAAVLLALPGLVPGVLIALAGRHCTSLDCLGVAAVAVGAGFLGVLPLMVWWARRLGLGVAWALLTTAGLTVLAVAQMQTIVGALLPLFALAVVAFPAGSAWATTPERAWWMRLLRIVTVAIGVAVVVASYQAAVYGRVYGLG